MRTRLQQASSFAVLLSVAGTLCLTAGLAAFGDGGAADPAGIEDLRARLDGLVPTADYLADRQAIRDVSMRYLRGADRHDKELARSAFWPDATISYGEPLRRDSFVDSEEQRLAGFAAHQHHITGQTVEIADASAHVESYVIYFLVPRDKSADSPGPASPGKPMLGDRTYLGSGRYIERWEQRDGEWRILVREYVEDLALEGETVDYCAERDCLSAWDRTDLSYIRPLEHLTPEKRRKIDEGTRRQTNPQANETEPASEQGSS